MSRKRSSARDRRRLTLGHDGETDLLNQFALDGGLDDIAEGNESPPSKDNDEQSVGVFGLPRRRSHSQVRLDSPNDDDGEVPTFRIYGQIQQFTIPSGKGEGDTSGEPQKQSSGHSSSGPAPDSPTAYDRRMDEHAPPPVRTGGLFPSLRGTPEELAGTLSPTPVARKLWPSDHTMTEVVASGELVGRKIRMNFRDQTDGKRSTGKSGESQKPKSTSTSQPKGEKDTGHVDKAQERRGSVPWSPRHGPSDRHLLDNQDPILDESEALEKDELNLDTPKVVEQKKASAKDLDNLLLSPSITGSYPKGPLSPVSKRCFRSFVSLSKVGYVPMSYKVNQDRALEVYPFGQLLFKDAGKRAFFAVFDGHGQHGHMVSTFLQKKMAIALMKQLRMAEVKQSCKDVGSKPKSRLDGCEEGLSHQTIMKCLSQAYVATGAELDKNKSVPSVYSGSTAVSCYLSGNNLYTACVGDSRAVLGRVTRTTKKPKVLPSLLNSGNLLDDDEGIPSNLSWEIPAKHLSQLKKPPKGGERKYEVLTAVDLTFDQTPERDDEKRRVIKAGADVYRRGKVDDPEMGPYRLWHKKGRGPGLAMTRAFGDSNAHIIGVHCEPETAHYVLKRSDKFIILASDGVWEFISSQEAVDIVGSSPKGDAACKKLVAEATRRWLKEEVVSDDITVIIVYT